MTQEWPLPSPLVESCFQTFKTAYAAQNYGIASEAFLEALNAEPDPTYRYFATQMSGQVSDSLKKTKRLDKVTAILDALLERYPNMHLMYYGSQSITDYFIRLREENIAKGLPSVLLVTQGKSGSVSIANVFSSGFALPSYAYSLVTQRIVPSWLNDYARGGACYATHLMPLPQVVNAIRESGIEKIIVHVRDPRQAVVSMMHHIGRYADQLLEIQNFGFNEKTPHEKLRMLTEVYLNSVQWLEGWVAASKHLPIFFSTFEDFAKDTPAFIQKYVDWYGVPEHYFNYEQATKQHAGTDYHFRKGSTDEWQEVMSEDIKNMFSMLIPAEIKTRFGWPD